MSLALILQIFRCQDLHSADLEPPTLYPTFILCRPSHRPLAFDHKRRQGMPLLYLYNGKVCRWREGAIVGLHPCGWLIHTHDKVHLSKGQCRACRQLLLPPSYLVSHTQREKHHSIIQ